jgi:hypothetical protein
MYHVVEHKGKEVSKMRDNEKKDRLTNMLVYLFAAGNSFRF